MTSLLPSGLPDLIDDDESLARFLIQSNQFTATVVKPSAFLPNPKDRETSVSRHGQQPADRLWQLGSEAAGLRTLYGAALLKARDVRAITLKVDSAEPPDHHAVIVGWPWIETDLELQKAQQKEKALQLASAAGAPVLLR